MLTAAIVSTLLGMALGLRFKVLVLAPVIVLTLLLAVGATIAHPSSAWTAGETAALVIAALQISYLFGIGMRHLTVLARAGRRRAASNAGALLPRRSVH